MIDEPAHGRPPRRGLIWRILGPWPDPQVTDGLWESLDGATQAGRLDRARAWLASASPQERATGLTVLVTTDRDGALGSLLDALDDPDKRVRSVAFMHLLWHDAPEGHGERIVAHLGGELRAAERWVDERWPPGAIGSLGLTDRLLPYLEQIARNSTRRKARRRAAAYARILRDHAPGWPLVAESSSGSSV